MYGQTEGSSFVGGSTLEFVITSLTPFLFVGRRRPRPLSAFDGRGRFPPLLVLLLVNI